MPPTKPATGAEPEPLKLTTPVESLPGVTPERGAALRALGVKSLAHLVLHLPHRHETIEPETTISQLVAGHVVSVRGEVTATRTVQHGSRPRFEAVIVDPTGSMEVQWFNMLFLRGRITPGSRIRVQGKLKRTRTGYKMANPQVGAGPR